MTSNKSEITKRIISLIVRIILLVAYTVILLYAAELIIPGFGRFIFLFIGSIVISPAIVSLIDSVEDLLRKIG